MATSSKSKLADTSKSIPSLRSCNFCVNKYFETPGDFSRHLRESHCAREGGSFVCRYGYNGVCSSLPVEGVSDRDYEDHVMKHHMCNDTMKADGSLQFIAATNHLQGHLYRLSLLEDGPAWNVNAACQNMAAILNDPKRGIQKDFFTRNWGEDFVENANIPPHHLLPEVHDTYFSVYLKKLSRRHRKSPRRQSGTVNTELAKQFPNLQTAKAMEKSQMDFDSIPKVFVQSGFNLSQKETFYNVFPFVQESGVGAVLKSGKILQEKLSFYLDIVETQIAQQISAKSESFFQAVASHDTVREELGKALTAVQALRLKVKNIDENLVKGSLKVVQLKIARQNYMAVYSKLKLMATVHQTQPTIQLLLSTSEFVGALDLISTTQEVLLQELANIHCFRYLGSQLSEMENLIEKMLLTEFERYATAELNRPLEDTVLITEEDRLSSVLLGMLRQRRYNFIELFKEECLTTMKAVLKQQTIESLVANDIDVEGRVVMDQARHLGFAEWIALMRGCARSLTLLLKRVKAVHDVMVSVVTIAAKRQEEAIIQEAESQKMITSLREMLQSICDSAHERCAKLLSSRTKDGGLLGRVSSQDFVALAQLIDRFSNDTEELCGRRSPGLRLALQGHVTKFVQKFHEERRSKLGAILDSERWKQAEVPPEVQSSVNKFLALKKASAGAGEGKQVGPNCLTVAGDSYVVVGAALFFLPQLFEYCACVDDMLSAAPDLLTRTVELLKTFNSRTCQLVLGAGALPLVGLKTITSRNLALASRSLQLIARFVPLIKEHFEDRLPAKQKTMVKHFDQALKDYEDHVNEIDSKLATLLCEMVESHLATWEVKPPVPSVAFRAICKQLTKLHEAISSTWPHDQTRNLYDRFNGVFKEMLKQKFSKLGVSNNGGPQHGLVTSELVFYVQNLKSLKVLDPDESMESFSKDLWT